MSAFKKVKVVALSVVPSNRFVQVQVPAHPIYSKSELIFQWQNEKKLGNFMAIFADFKGYKTWGISYIWNIEPTVPFLMGRPSPWWNPRIDPIEYIQNSGEVRATHIVENLEEWISSNEETVNNIVPDRISRAVEAASLFFDLINPHLRQRLATK